jgi:RHS repeat-associated protein
LTRVPSSASLDLVSGLRWFVTVVLVLVAVLVPSRASASMAPASETRIGDFHLAHPVLVGVITAQTPGKHRAISLFVYDPASDRCFRWKSRPFLNLAGGLYDMRARWWSPGMGAFLSIDQYAYHDARSTLWGWGGQNPIRWSDPTGHDVADWLISSGFYANSPTYINIAGGIALGAAAIATGGLALEAVGGSALAGGLGAGAPALAALADNEGPEISSAEMTVSDLIKSLNDLYSSQPDASAILTQFFKANLGGGDIVLTPGINSDLLEIYLQIALRAKDPLGVQAQRIDLIERTLGCGKP